MSDTSEEGNYVETEEQEPALGRFIAEEVEQIPPPGWVRKGNGWARKK